MSGSTGYSAANLAIPYVTPDNVPPAAKPYINPIYVAFQNIIQVLISFAGIAPRNPAAILSSVNDPTAILSSNGHRFYTITLEAIAQGAAINLYASAGTLFARNAIASDLAHRCDGFCSQTGGLTPGQAGEFILNDGSLYQGVGGLIVGARYYLSPTSPGLFTAVKPVTTGQVVQYVGIAISTNALRFWTGEPIQL